MDAKNVLNEFVATHRHEIRGAGAVLAVGTTMGGVLKGSTIWRGFAFSIFLTLLPYAVDKLNQLAKARLLKQSSQSSHNENFEPFFTKRRVLILLASLYISPYIFRGPASLTMPLLVIPFDLFVKRVVMGCKRDEYLEDVCIDIGAKTPVFISSLLTQLACQFQRLQLLKPSTSIPVATPAALLPQPSSSTEMHAISAPAIPRAMPYSMAQQPTE